ncbi:glycosyltransferase family 4 protein [Candidatus Woesearchaeota archaeon]|nr:glycosyltransferase family 4 protein [Candidatus Woesearchaeota archaeon]
MIKVTATTEWMVDDRKSLSEKGYISPPNRLLPNSYYDQAPFRDGELADKTRIAVFAGGDDDSKRLAVRMARDAVSLGKTVELYYRPHWMPTQERLPSEQGNAFHATITDSATLADIVKGLNSPTARAKKLRQVDDIAADLQGRQYDGTFVVGTYWNRAIPEIRGLGKLTGYFASAVDCEKGDSFFAHFMERYLIEMTDEVRTVDSKNRQVLEDRHENINKNIIFVHEQDSPLKGLKVLFLPEFDLKLDMVPRWRAEWPSTNLGDYGVRYRVRGALEGQTYRPTIEERRQDPSRATVEIDHTKEPDSLRRVLPDIDWADVIIFQRTSNMFSKTILDYAKATGKPIGYDIDDLTFGDRAIPAFKAAGLDKAVEEQMKSADFVTVSTEALRHEAAKVRGSTDNIFQIRNRLPLKELARTKAKKRPERHNDIRIGWAGGSVHKPKLLDAKDMVHDLYDKYGHEVTFVLKGFDPSSAHFQEIRDAFREGGRDVRIEGHGYTPTKSWTDYYSDLKALDLDIFFAPARDDSEHYGKSELKYLEATHIGVPIVTPAVGEHALVIKHGVNGMLADVKDMNNTMFACIDQLIQNPTSRKRIAANARRRVAKEHDTLKSGEELHSLLRQVLQR